MAEWVCALAMYCANGTWIYYSDSEDIQQMFVPHPHLIGMPRPSMTIAGPTLAITHNSSGFRGPEIGPRRPGTLRVAVLGGSTTYGIGVGDADTWPARLQVELGSHYEVINMGVPAHSTAEHVVLTTLLLPDYAPDIVLVHAGLNDMTASHVRNLAPDYSNYLGPRIYDNLNLNYRRHLPRIALLHLLSRIAERVSTVHANPFATTPWSGTTSSGSDSRALDLFARNLRTIVTQATSRGARVIFVPQVLLREAVIKHHYAWWAPYIPESEMPIVLSQYNDTMRNVARETAQAYVDDVRLYPWSPGDFVDASHMGAQANARLALIVADAIRNL